MPPTKKKSEAKERDDRRDGYGVNPEQSIQPNGKMLWGKTF
jgi:hypothetical protein